MAKIITNMNFSDYFYDIRRKASAAESNLALEQYLNDWLIEPGQRHIALLTQGDISTGLLRWTYNLLNKEHDHTAIPLFIDLNGMSPHNLQPPLQFLGAWTAPYNINPQALMRLADRLVLIFHDFDKADLVTSSDIRLKHFKSLWKFASVGAKLLITSKPGLFPDTQELTDIGAAKPADEEKPYVDVLLVDENFKPVFQSNMTRKTLAQRIGKVLNMKMF
jgi:hypothetical protein